MLKQKILAALALLLSTAPLAISSARAALPPCVDCGAQAGVDPGSELKITDSLFDMGVPRIVSTLPALPTDIDKWVNHKNGDPLPNSFERPWAMGPGTIDTYRWVYDQASGTRVKSMTPFCPNFVTSYYDSNVGILWNSPTAPWNVVANAWKGTSSGFGSRPASHYPSNYPVSVPARVPTRLQSALAAI